MASMRTAKSAYQREQRAQARARRQAAEARGERYVARGITHGLGGYQRHSCRCIVCRAANASAAAKSRARKKSL